MRHRETVVALAAIIVVVLVVQVGREVYAWHAHGAERARIERLSKELEEAGLEVVRTQVAANSLHTVIDGLDEGLEGSRANLESYERRAVSGAAPRAVYEAYLGELSAYNLRVRERNRSFEAWRGVIERNHAAVGRFNGLARSIREIAADMGEPYYPIPTPAEIALDRGLAPPAPR